jgi:hypothetical protein
MRLDSVSHCNHCNADWLLLLLACTQAARCAAGKPPQHLQQLITMNQKGLKQLDQWIGKGLTDVRRSIFFDERRGVLVFLSLSLQAPLERLALLLLSGAALGVAQLRRA